MLEGVILFYAKCFVFAEHNWRKRSWSRKLYIYLIYFNDRKGAKNFSKTFIDSFKHMQTFLYCVSWQLVLT